MDMQTQDPKKEEFSPSAWFAALERARLTGNAALELIARRELRRLGVTVRFRNSRGAACSKTGGRITGHQSGSSR